MGWKCRVEMSNHGKLKMELMGWMLGPSNFFKHEPVYGYPVPSVPVLPRAAREAPLVASACRILGVA
jgi:hypothetical protein